jgi:hypothetical protein
MNTLTVNTNPTPDKNSSYITIDLLDYDIFTGPLFQITFYNSNKIIIDRNNIQLGLEAYQNWPSSESENDDFVYVKNIILDKIGLTEQVDDTPTDTPVV